MIEKFKQIHEKQFVDIIESMWKEKSTYSEISYEYLDRYWYEDKYYNEDYVFFISDDKNGRINGFILGEIKAEEIEITFLFVRPEDRRKNIGTSLKRQVIKYAQVLGLNEVTALNLHSNERSLGMNVKLGNKIQDDITHLIEYLDEYYYRSVYVLNEDSEWYGAETEDTSEIPNHINERVAMMTVGNSQEWYCDCQGCNIFRQTKAIQ